MQGFTCSGRFRDRLQAGEPVFSSVGPGARMQSYSARAAAHRRAARLTSPVSAVRLCQKTACAHFPCRLEHVRAGAQRESRGPSHIPGTAGCGLSVCHTSHVTRQAVRVTWARRSEILSACSPSPGPRPHSREGWSSGTFCLGPLKWPPGCVPGQLRAWPVWNPDQTRRI